MIKKKKKRKCQVAFELQNLLVFEKQSSWDEQEEGPQQAKCESCLPQGQSEIEDFFEPCVLTESQS